ncbi:MAG: short-chain dehydrogenase/reductase [Phycisphaerales bacterium]|nr:short-chain dehydrogenase/reductase [Phycisphaerales bacterium]
MTQQDRPGAKTAENSPTPADQDVSPQTAPPGHEPSRGAGEQGRPDLPTPNTYPGEQQHLVEASPDQPQTKAEPKPPYPKEKLEEPGLEKEMSLKPQYMAPRYKATGKLEGKTALVTGGDSGIGRAVAVLYAREGADVAIVCTPAEQPDAEETRRAVEAEGRRFVMILGDLTDPKFCRDCVERCVRELGKLDILVSNAAYQNRKQSLEEITEEEWRRTFATNIDAYFYLTKAAMKHLQPGSAIIATSSEVGLVGSSSLLDYGATKGAIIAFTKSLAQQLADKGIRANCVAPGPVWTPLNPADRGMSPEKLAEFGQKQPMKRAAQPEEIAPAYVFLASDADSSYVTGIVLEEMGGLTTG